jgi:Flp pilus assembly protein TadG
MRMSFLRDVSGNVATMFAIAMVPLALAAGAAMDMSRANHVRTVLQGAADAAALAGATTKNASDSELDAMVHQYLAANNALDVLEHVSDIDQKLDHSKGTFEVEIEGKIRTTFMVVAGITEMDVGAYSEVNVGSMALEVALVLDNTGSMSGTKIENLKAAATNLVNVIENESSGYADIKIGVVPFAEYVNVGASNSGAPWIDMTTVGGGAFLGCVGSRVSPKDLQEGFDGVDKYPALSNEPCNAEVLPLTNNFSAVRSKISGLLATGNTYVPTGVLWGWNVLTASAPFTQAKTKQAMQDARGRKVMIVMTDGENTISPSYPKHDASDTATSNSNLTALCNNVKNDEIEVYAVSFMISTPTIENLLVDCATVPTKYFNADNSAQLYQAFSDIAKDLATVRLTQ